MKFKTFIWLLVLAWLWGPAFLFTKVAVQDIPPLTLVAARLVLAAMLLYLILKFQGHSLPKFGPIWKHFWGVGLLYNALPYVLLSWGQQYIDSAPAAILIGTTPIFTMILAHLFSANDHFTLTKGGGVLLGFAGLAILLAPELAGGVEATTWGLLAALGAAASYGGAVVYTRQKLRGFPPLVGPTAQLTAAAIILLPLSLLVEQPYNLPLPSWPALGSLVLLAVVSTALAFVVYYRAMETISATVLSMTTYIIPIVATILGVVVLSERLDWHVYLGCVFIIAGVMVVNDVFRSSGWRQLRSAVVRP
ncbi:MAG TPA: EamA family transporter [Anaerolineae bacterium]|nr:EamA family transporter [Anaerolineae bacterium]